MYVFVTVFAVLYGLIIYYIGQRGWMVWGPLLSPGAAGWYTVILLVCAFSYIVGRMQFRFVPSGLSNTLTVIGSWWFALMFYLLMAFLVLDILRLFDFRTHWLAAPLQSGKIGLIIAAAVLLTVLAGAWNARHPRVTHYDITIPKPAGDLKNIKVIAVSDVHLGTIIHNGRLLRLVDMINREDPDLVLFGGDTIDESVQHFVEQNMAESLKQLHPRLGAYAVFGNHEYISGQPEETRYYLEQAGIHVLKDRWVKVADAFYIAGRDEGGYYQHERGQKRRQSIETILHGTDRSCPILLLQHQPVDLQEAADQGVDLMFCGHTHKGQLFPLHYITRSLFEIDWGYLRKGNLHVIVSSGYGTWGPPIRLGNRPEIVVIDLHFKP